MSLSSNVLGGRALGLVLGVGMVGALLSLGITQEVPLGQIKGTILMQENKKALPEALVTFTPMSDIDKDVIRTRYVYSDKKGAFSLRNVPAGPYEMEVSAEHHSAKMRYVWVDEGKLQDLKDIELKPNDPFIQLYASQRVFTPEETPRIEIHGFTSAEKVGVTVYKLDLDNLAKKGGLQEALYPISNRKVFDTADGVVVSNEENAVKSRDIEGAFVGKLNIPKLKEGFYLIKATADPKLTSATYLNVTKIAMITKSSKGKVLGYVTDIRTGVPISGATIQARNGDNLKKVGSTNSEGTINIDYPDAGQLALIAKSGTSTALVGFGGDDRQATDLRIVTYTERPVYRPGDEVFFKSVLRRVADNKISLPGTGTAKVSLKDIDGNIVETKSFPIDRHGMVTGSFKTASEAEPGYWNLTVEAFGGEDSHSFPLETYRKPEYTVNVSPTKPYFIIGQVATAKVHSEYYFGGPVIGAKVTATIYRTPTYNYGYGNGDEEYDSYDDTFQGGEFYQEIEAITDANGDATINFDTRAKGDPNEYPTDFTYTVAASVADEGDKYFDGQGDVNVMRGDFGMTVDSASYVVSPGEEYKLNIQTFGHDKDAPLPNQTVTIAVGREEWTRRTSFVIPEKTFTVTTDAEGKAQISVPAGKPGSIKIEAVADDKNGNKILAEAYVWCAGPGASMGPDASDLKLTLDKKVYDPNDKAKVLIQTQKPGGSALVTVEADQVMWQKVVKLDTDSTILEIPILARYSPNAFVDVHYIKDKVYMSDEKRFKETRADQNLTVSVTPNQKDYKPGDVAELTINTKDDQGNPTPADVSVAVVDEAIYAIRKDDTNIVKSLYPSRYNQVRTAYSFPDVYLDGGDKGEVQVSLRTKFKDMAFWQPSVETDASGTAKVRFQLPDNLTEWRATAIGVTDSSVAGMATSKFKAHKELMVRLQPPMYLTQYDTQRMAVIVTNDTGKDQDVKVQVSAQGVELQGDANQTVRVAAGKPESLVFTLSASNAGEATLTAKAWIDGGPNDGVQQKLPINIHARTDVTASAGEAKPSATETVTRDANAEGGQVKVNVSASISGGLIQVLPGLVDFPYGCTEQTMSRFMPAVVVGSTMKSLSLSMPELTKKIPLIAADSYARLAKMQHPGGDWGWWEYDDPNPFMTALVLDGIDRANRAGYPAKFVDMKKALDAAAKLSLEKPTHDYELSQWDRNRLYLAYVLARYGRDKDATAAIGKFDIKKAQSSEAAFAILAGQQLHRSDLVDGGLNRLKALGNETAITASWPQQPYSWGEEPTALALLAYLEARPNDPIVPKIVRYMMISMKGSGWTSTRVTNYAVIAMTQYLTTHPEQLKNVSDVTVSLNGKSITQVSLDAGSPTMASQAVTIPGASLVKGENKISINATGGQSIFYTVKSTQYINEKLLVAIPAKGLTINREYFVMEPRRVQDGSLRLLPSEKPVTQVKPGDLIRATLTINSDQERQFVMVEDPVPSNCRVTERTDVDSSSDWGWWWSKTVIRDDRISFFTTWLPKGKSVITYTMKAESPGIGNALPTHIENMYDPSQRASGTSQSLEITR